MRLQPYVHFDGRCEEAIEFYKKALGAEVNMLMRFKDMPASCGPNGITPGTENKVMHANLKIGESELLVSDGDCKGQKKHDGFSLTVNVANDAQADRAFNALSEGGTVCMPLQKTFFSSKFGMLNDRFGISWMVIVEQKQ
jgi:PhnB protein